MHMKGLKLKLIDFTVNLSLLEGYFIDEGHLCFVLFCSAWDCIVWDKNYRGELSGSVLERNL